MKEKKFDLDSIKNSISSKNNRYEKRLSILRDHGQDISRISLVVDSALKNIQEGKKSFVIYGEPQSGKTEMMIALTAKLLDEGAKIIVELLNDSVQLLDQNLERFQRSGLSPSPRKFSEIVNSDLASIERQCVIFCKKNSKDLQKLVKKIENKTGVIVIDDEADFATPNSKVNEQEKSKINELTGKLIESGGIYIGVTATPARLDLNRTHSNVNKDWIDFPVHEKYTGQDIFFPNDITSLKYRLTFLPENPNYEESIRNALFSYMVNVAYLNTTSDEEFNFSFLIHTSGKKSDHSKDYSLIITVFDALRDNQNKHHELFFEKIWETAAGRYPGFENKIVEYILISSEQHNIVVMNSDKEVNAADNRTATSPTAPFTIIIGGNIVSRGVTFNNLLSMYFTRDVKQKLQQDTYIQRARMFGSRGKFLDFFELTIPRQLFLDWQRCFIFHRLSLDSRKFRNESPVWLDGQRVAAVASTSIDNTTVIISKGEMSFGLFDFPNNRLAEIIDSDIPSLSKAKEISILLGPECLPSYLIDYMENFSPSNDESIAVHMPLSIAGYSDIPGETDKATISRTRGFIGNRELEVLKFPNAIHHISVLYNEIGKARIFYKYRGDVRFLKT